MLVKTFVFLFEILDPESHKVLARQAEQSFLRHFMNLFSEFNSQPVVFGIMDLLFLLGDP